MVAQNGFASASLVCMKTGASLSLRDKKIKPLKIADIFWRCTKGALFQHKTPPS
jgi:hypothetical protein